jgi:large subunit ribosomal protein L23
MSSIFNKIISKRKEKTEEKEKKTEEKKEEKEKPKVTAGITIGEYTKKSVLKKPWITEKSRNMELGSKYVFEVTPKANKSEIKKEIEARYNVTVISVNITKKRKRPKQFRGIKSRPKIQKKAVATLKKGDKIEIFSI